MGYKRIGSAIHNFAHSFASLMNYFEGEYIIDILGKVVPRLLEGELRIRFPGGRIEPQREYPKPLREAVRGITTNGSPATWRAKTCRRSWCGTCRWSSPPRAMGYCTA
jgi:hypothetical protein